MRKYNPSPKHEAAWIPGVKESYLDLSSTEAETLLNDDTRCKPIPGEPHFVAVDGGKIYIFRFDGVDGYHAYPVTGNEIYMKFPSVKEEVASLLSTTVKRLSRMID